MSEPKPEFDQFADRIELELRRIGAWETVRPPDEKLVVTSAFGHETMPFTRWIQYVLLERLRAVGRGETDPPTTSSVGTFAVRELDGWYEADALSSLLSELDGMIMRRGRNPLERMTEDEELQLFLDLDEQRRRERGE